MGRLQRPGGYQDPGRRHRLNRIAAGVGDFRFHDLRPQAVAELAERGALRPARQKRAARLNAWAGSDPPRYHASAEAPLPTPQDLPEQENSFAIRDSRM
jgi:hypothetical protein